MDLCRTFKDRMVIDMMVTHPAYWRKGHATTVTDWFLELAKLDGIGLGVAGAPMGKVFFSHIGFKEAKTVEIPGYEAHPSPHMSGWGSFLSIMMSRAERTGKRRSRYPIKTIPNIQTHELAYAQEIRSRQEY